MKQSFNQTNQSKPIRWHIAATALLIITALGATGCQQTTQQPITTTAAISEATTAPQITTAPEITTNPQDTSQPANQGQLLAQNLSLDINSPYSLKATGKSQKTSTTLWKNQDDTYTLEEKATGISLGTLTIKNITVTDQMATYLHITFQGNGEIIGLPQPLTLDMPLAATKDQYTITNLNPGASAAFYQSPTQSLFISALQAYEPLSKETYRRQPNPAQTSLMENNLLHLTFPIMAANLAEYWLVVSPEQLLDPQDQTEVALLKRMDFDQNRQWSSLGNLEQVPNKGQGIGSDVFRLNYGYHVGNKLLQQGTSHFSSVYAVAAAQQLLSRYPEAGFNADAAEFTANLGSMHQLTEAKAAMNRYIDFYKTYVSQNSFLFKKANRVYRLPMDYTILTAEQMAKEGKDAVQAINQASLTAVLSQTNLLYRHYLLTTDATSKQLANELIESLGMFGKEWIKPEGGLWYAYQPVNGFILASDVDVTLNDLYQCQVSYLSANGRASAFIREMIVALEAYRASGAKK